VLLKGSPEKYLEQGFLGREEVEGAFPVTGEHDLLLKLRFRSMKEFNRFLVEFRERYRRSVRETLTLVSLGALKDGVA
jgi:DNA-binding Lrp family transcriptional regulator